MSVSCIPLGDSCPTAWNEMPAHLRNSDLTLSDFKHLLENCSVPDCFSSSCRTHLCDSLLLTVRSKMTVYY